MKSLSVGAERPKKFLFVCQANVCRSPIAEVLFDAVAEEAGLRWRAKSAGVAALTGEDITPKALATLEKLGIHAGGHLARHVTEEMLERANLVLTMSPDPGRRPSCSALPNTPNWNSRLFGQRRRTRALGV